MSKYLKMIRNILFYVIVHIISQCICGISLTFMYGISHSELSMEELKQGSEAFYMSNLYNITAVAAIISFIIFYFVFKNKEKNLWERCEFRVLNSSYAWKVILAVVGLAFFSCAGITLLQNYFESYQVVQDSITKSYSSILSMFCIIVFIPIIEEMLFRGLIFSELKKNLNIVIAIILQAIIFAVAHGNILQMIYTFALGATLGAILYWTKSLWATILGHVVYNALGSVIVPIIIGYSIKLIHIYAVGGFLIVILALFLIYKQYISKNINTNL